MRTGREMEKKWTRFFFSNLNASIISYKKKNFTGNASLLS